MPEKIISEPDDSRNAPPAGLVFLKNARVVFRSAGRRHCLAVRCVAGNGEQIGLAVGKASVVLDALGAVVTTKRDPLAASTCEVQSKVVVRRKLVVQNAPFQACAIARAAVDIGPSPSPRRSLTASSSV